MKKLIAVLFLVFAFIQQCTFANEKINVAFTIDDNYALFAMLTINSILQNNISNSEYTFYIVEDNLSNKNKKIMEKYVKKQNQKVEFINIDTKKIANGENLFKYLSRITPIGMARILLPDLLPKELHKVLYLDADLLVTTDIKNLYDTNLENKPVGMVLNFVKHNKAEGIHKFKEYYNSGVILIDLDLWRKDKISEQLLDYINKNKKYFSYNGVVDGFVFLYPDQDLLNIVLENRIKKLPNRWNVQSPYLFEDNGIMHYAGPDKPWKMGIKRTRRINIYQKYWRNSPFAMYKICYGIDSLKNEYLTLIRNKYLNYKNLFKIHYFKKLNM